MRSSDDSRQPSGVMNQNGIARPAAVPTSHFGNTGSIPTRTQPITTSTGKPVADASQLTGRALQRFLTNEAGMAIR